MREKIREWKVGADIACEKTPFHISKDKKTGNEVVKAKPMAYVIDLKEHIMRHLETLAE